MAVPLIIAGLANSNVEDTAILVSGALLASGICSIIKSKGFGPKNLKVGIGLPTIMGTDFGFVPAEKAVINTMGGGLAGYFGATFMGVILELVLSFLLGRL